MAVEKMKMMNIVALRQDTHHILRDLVLDGSLHITNSSNSSNFTLRYLEAQKQIFEDMGLDIQHIVPYQREKIFRKKQYQDLLNRMFDFFNIKKPQLFKEKLSKLNYSEKLKLLDQMVEETKRIETTEKENRDARKRTSILLNALSYFYDSDLQITDFKHLQHIQCHLGQISRNAWIKLKSNYENIKALVIHLGSGNNTETIMVFTTLAYETESQNFLKSLSFDEIEWLDHTMSFKELIAIKRKELVALQAEQEKIEREKEAFKKQYELELFSLYYRYKIIEKIEELENHTAQSQNFMILSGFIPASKVEKLESIVKKSSPSAVVHFKDDIDVPSRFIIPTRLKNNTFLRPFETLVKMYSIPDYKEADPTPFFALTYMLLFGMMFGDVGQGLIFILAGFLLSKKVGAIGKIMERIGASSVLFGFLYGSFFGMENILPALLIRPMEDINTILLATISLGVLLIVIAYGIGFYNLKSSNRMGELYFDKNGITGFIFYLSFLTLVITTIKGKDLFPQEILSMMTLFSAALMVITSCIMFMKPKLIEKIESQHAQPHQQKTEGFSPVESGFELFETIMGFFSNTLSFIRVGAFAINHVGLFMAFHALGQMIGTGFGNILMIVIGNIVILGLEGLIVSIQAIRLEYYELFSKYFKGDGLLYEPIHVDIKNMQ